MPRLYLGGIGDARQVDPSVALAHGRAELIKFGQLRVGELDPQGLGALDQRAHV